VAAFDWPVPIRVWNKTRPYDLKMDGRPRTKHIGPTRWSILVHQIQIERLGAKQRGDHHGHVDGEVRRILMSTARLFRWSWESMEMSTAFSFTRGGWWWSRCRCSLPKTERPSGWRLVAWWQHLGQRLFYRQLGDEKLTRRCAVARRLLWRSFRG
jgi:hypothetical protein